MVLLNAAKRYDEVIAVANEAQERGMLNENAKGQLQKALRARVSIF